MKNFILIFITICCSTVALAHPKETDSLSKLGVGSILRVTRDINVVPKTTSFNFESEDNRSNQNKSSCQLFFSKEVDYDRVLSVGRILKIRKIQFWSHDIPEDFRVWDDPHTYKAVQIFFENEPHIDSMLCSTYKLFRSGSSFIDDITIKDARQVLAPYMVIELAKPVKI